jgi:hypothetical protein
MVLVFDVKRDCYYGDSARGPVYQVAPLSEREWQSYLRGEAHPQIINGTITKLYKETFVETNYQNAPNVFPKIGPPPWNRPGEITFDMFQVRSSVGSLTIEAPQRGEKSYYVIGRHAKVESMRFYTPYWFPMTFQACAGYPTKRVHLLPTRIWIEADSA